MEIKNARIDKIVQVKEWNSPNGTIFYHWLELDNGDLIDIGKKNPLQVGWQVTYKITDTQHKYNKAKSASKDEAAAAGISFSKPSGTSSGGTDVDLKISIGHAINNAVQLCIAQKKLGVTDIREAAKGILNLSREMYQEETSPKSEPQPSTGPALTPEQPDDDLPF